MKKVMLFRNLLRYIWDIPAWTRVLKLCGWSEKAIHRLELLDDEIIGIIKEAESEYFEKQRVRSSKQLLEFKDEIRKEYGQKWIDKARLEVLDKEIAKLDLKIGKIIKADNDAFKLDVPYWLRKIIREAKGLTELNLELKKKKTLKFLIENPSLKGKMYSKEQIDVALAVPFTDLIEAKRDFAICPFHEETKPSFHIVKKENYAYCFGCSKSWNTINFIMDLKDLKFRQAVAYLLKIKVG